MIPDQKPPTPPAPIDKRKTRINWEREARFAEEYAKHGNGARAATDAGYQAESKRVAWRLLSRPRVQAMIKEARGQIAQAAHLDGVWVTSRLMKEADTAPRSAQRIRALEVLARMVPDLLTPERVEVSTMSADERRELERRILERAQARALATPE